MHRLSMRMVMCICLFIGLGLSSAAYTQPTPLRGDVEVRQVLTLNSNALRIRQDPASGNLYVLERDGDVKRVNLNPSGTSTLTTIHTSADHGIGEPLGMAFADDGTLFLVGISVNGQLGTGTIARGVPDSAGSENRTWSILAETVEYLFGFTYNHKMSGIVVDPSGDYIYVNSGSRTDHGEVREGEREVGLTSIILKLPTAGENILLQDDRAWLRSNGYLMAEGIRNTFDLDFAGNGDLFGVENSGDRDDPEEMNWIREGHHYGFPWRMGGNDTPQQFQPYDPTADPLLSPSAWGGGNLYVTFSNDPDYPAVPDSITLTEPVQNTGPDADKFRDPVTGSVMDASDEGVSMGTFTTHRSPNGIVFDEDSLLLNELAGGAFVISLNNGSLLTALGDNGNDLLHVDLQKAGDSSYTSQVTRIVSDFTTPLGIELVDDKLYVLETGQWGGNGSPDLWEVTLPLQNPVGIEDVPGAAQTFTLAQNYPNPFNPSTTIEFVMNKVAEANLDIYNIRGQKIRTLVSETVAAGRHLIEWNGKDDSGRDVKSGIYFYRLRSESNTKSMKMFLTR